MSATLVRWYARLPWSGPVNSGPPHFASVSARPGSPTRNGAWCQARHHIAYILAIGYLYYEFGFTERQARFLVTVMLHSGVRLLRQYTASRQSRALQGSQICA